MAELRETFPILADFSTGEGLDLHSIQAGDAPSTRRGILAFGFRNSAGNVVLPQLDAENRLPVTMDSSGVNKRANGELAAGSATMVDITGATISLTISKRIGKITWKVSCFIESIFNLVHTNDAVITIVDQILVGPGQYTFESYDSVGELLSGATGTQTLKIQGQNAFNKLSSMKATLSLVEFA